MAAGFIGQRGRLPGLTLQEGNILLRVSETTFGRVFSMVVGI